MLQTEQQRQKRVLPAACDSLQETMRAVSERAGGSFGKLQNHQFTLGRNLNDIEDRI
ncbi:hypothetical protein KHA80_13335 [Anaerobacillus sp. HL2]|nr:hypothetical protein KHA80_13335 [Anaerobacillus sp. HL2]